MVGSGPRHTVSPPRRKQDIWLTISLALASVMFAWFGYEARKVREAVYQGQRELSAISARVDSIDGRLVRVERQVEEHVSAQTTLVRR